jgi:hypothetical protein
LPTNTVDNDALAMEHRSVRHAYALQNPEQAKNVVILAPQYVDLLIHPKYTGEGEPLPHGDPPIPMTGHLPQPLGHSVPRNTECYDICPLEDICFKELHELTKMTSPAACTQEMNIQ